MTWNYAYTAYIWPMLASSLFSGAIAVYAWRHKTVPGTIAFAIQNLFNALWALFTAMEIASIDIAIKFVYHKLEAVAAIVSVSALLYFAMARAGASQKALRRVTLLNASIVLAVFVLMATNDLHHLIWNRLYYDQVVRVDRGPLNIVMLGWVVMLPAVAIGLFFWMSIRSNGVYRQQAVVLSIAALLPVLTYFLEFAGINPIAPLDPVILIWNVSSLLFALAIFRFHMLSIVPIGRHTAIERMTDAVLILDAEGQIVDINPTARSILALSKGEAVGQKATRVLAACPGFSKLLEQDSPSTTEISIQHDGQARYYQAQASPLNQPGGWQLGRLILLRDITGQKQNQTQMVEHQRALAMLQERERLARELHDSTSQVLSYASLKVGATRKLIADGRLEKADSQLADLESVISDAHADLREYILNLQTSSAGDRSFFATLRQYLEGYHHNYSIQVDISFDVNVAEEFFSSETQLQLLRILQEALSNARRHGHADSVRILFTREDNHAIIRIEDDGQGFDPRRDVSAESGHYGLRFMRERAEALGGSLVVHSVPGTGTCVQVEVPIRANVE